MDKPDSESKENIKDKAGDESKEKSNSKADVKSKEKTNANADDTSKEKTKAMIHKSTVKDAASSVSTGTGPGKMKSNEKSPIKGKSGPPSDVSVAEKASLESSKDPMEKRNVSVEKDKASVEKK